MMRWQCGAELAEDARFCGNCGAEQGRRCKACGAPARPEAAFCRACGAALEPERAPLQSVAEETTRVEPPPAPPPRGTRRLRWVVVGAAVVLLGAGGAVAAVLTLTGGGSPPTSVPRPPASKRALADELTPPLQALAASQDALNARVRSLTRGAQSFAVLRQAADALVTQVARTQGVLDGLTAHSSREATTLTLLREALSAHLAYAETISGFPPRPRSFTTPKRGEQSPAPRRRSSPTRGSRTPSPLYPESPSPPTTHACSWPCPQRSPYPRPHGPKRPLRRPV